MSFLEISYIVHFVAKSHLWFSKDILTTFKKSGKMSEKLENLNHHKKSLGLINLLLSRANDLCEFALSNFSDQEHILSEIGLRSVSLIQTCKTATSEATSAAQNVTDLTNSASHKISEINSFTQTSLSSLKTDIAKTAKDTLSVLETIKKISKETHILSLNARVEAARSGEYGAGFAVIAKEIGHLSNRTMSSAKEASEVLDLKDISNSLAQTTDEFQSKMLEFGQTIEATLAEIQNIIYEVRDQISEIKNYQSILNEMIETSQSSCITIRKKIKWTGNHVQEIAETCTNNSTQDKTTQFQNLCRKAAISYDPSYDRLETVKKNGSIRIGIDSTLIGLSFRNNNNSALTGLDVEYAQHFAKSIGVKCEFIEHDWDKLTELLYIGREPGEASVDAVWCGLPPDEGYRGVAFSETYTWLSFVICKRKNDLSITDIQSLDGKNLGIINDPSAFVILEKAGVRWAENANKPNAKCHLSSLLAFSDQSRIHNALTEGLVDAFAVDLPVFYWAAKNPESKWYDQIEIIPNNIHVVPFYYTVGLACQPSSYTLLVAINRFIDSFTKTEERKSLEQFWQGEVVNHTINYRNEAGLLVGEDEMNKMFVKTKFN
jgi:ABC-type amino acid transport substrate-binding protein